MDHKKEAIRLLGLLRQEHGGYDTAIAYLRGHVSKGGLTLADIGTSGEELERLRILGCAAAAKEWLRILRPNGLDSPHYFNQLQREIAKGGLLLADIGTTEEEIALFNKWK